MQSFISSFNRALQSSPFVLKKLNYYFGFYFVAFSLAILFFSHSFLPHDQEGQQFLAFSSLIKSALIFFSKTFTVFIIPYYVYEERWGKPAPFWLFISENLWPVVLNHIKALFVILFFLILFIIPGLYKMVRYSFLTETVLFDSAYKKGDLSALKSADKSTRGFFWLMFLYSALVFFLTVLFGDLKFSFLPGFLASGLGFVFQFYFAQWLILFKCQFYFELKERRGEKLTGI